jgi:hypothetical protein
MRFKSSLPDQLNSGLISAAHERIHPPFLNAISLGCVRRKWGNFGNAGTDRPLVGGALAENHFTVLRLGEVGVH